jgi:hypothetical protein
VRREQHANEDDDVSSLTGLTFLQRAVPVTSTNGTLHASITCYHCQTLGHYASKCPHAKGEEEGVQMLQVGPAPPIDTNKAPCQSEFTFLHLDEASGDFTFHQNDTHYDIIPNTWILLDSQSTVSVFKNRSLLSFSRTFDPAEARFAYTPMGARRFHADGDRQKKLVDVWYNTESLANIFSMAAIRARSGKGPS